MVMVNPGTSANCPLVSPVTVTATSVAVVSVRPSGREAVTVTVCDLLPSATSVLSNVRRMTESSSRMVRGAEVTGREVTGSGADVSWANPVTVKILSALTSVLSVMGRLKVAEPWLR